MTWTKTSDDFPDDCWTLSDAAYRLHHEGLTWSNRKLLDCRIPKGDVRRFAKCPDAVAELIAHGFWTDGGDHYVIRHHAGYQRTREQVIAIQERNKANGAKGGRPGKASREVWETQVGSQMATQRDRSGQDGALEEGESVPSPRAAHEWCMDEACRLCHPEMSGNGAYSR